MSPDYADNTKFADEWLPAQAGTDAALAMAMGHVILKENYVDQRVEFFEDFSLTYTDLPFLVTLETREDGVKVPSKFLTAAKLAGEAEQPNADFKPVLMDRETGEVFVPTAPWVTVTLRKTRASGTWICRVVADSVDSRPAPGPDSSCRD